MKSLSCIPTITGRLVAEVATLCTAREAIEGLLADDAPGPFLKPASPGRPYELVLMRTGDAITPNMTFDQAGATNGDIVEIRQAGQGGGPDWSQLGQMLFWSAAAASVFLKSASPIIIEFLKARSSRSITVERGEHKITVTGHNLDEATEMWKLLENEQSDKLWPPVKVTLSDPQSSEPAE